MGKVMFPMLKEPRMNFQHHIAGKPCMQRETVKNGYAQTASSCDALTSIEASYVNGSAAASPFQIISEIAL
jgi:hypothetical protein